MDTQNTFINIIAAASDTRSKYQPKLSALWFETPLGPMLAVGSEEHLYLVDFFDRTRLSTALEKLCIKNQSMIIPGITKPLISIKEELSQYFSGNLTEFKTPLHIDGTVFQQRAWQALRQIPYGHTRSYREQACAINQPRAYRAVARANSTNFLAIVIPCHRIINYNGTVGGYGSGSVRKQALISHEKKEA